MDITMEAVRNATEIIQIGLVPGRRPSTMKYNALVAAYQINEGGTRSVVKEMAITFGLNVVDVAMDGVVLSIGPERNSIFMPRRLDLLKDPGAEVKLIRGLCNAAILTCAYIRQQDMLSESVQEVTVNEAYDLLVSSANELSKSGDTSLKGYTEAAAIVKRIQTDSFTSKAERARKGTLRGRLIEAFESFVEHGQMVKDSDENGGTYKTLSRLRKLLADESAMVMVDVIKDAVEKSKLNQTIEETTHA